MEQLNSNEMVVWDRVTRLFHWCFASTILGAWVSAELNYMEIHYLLGYLLTLLLAIRIPWGFIGGHYSRFRHFIYSPSETWSYIQSSFRGEPKHYTGHNPAGAAMVYVLLLTGLTLVLTGHINLASIEFEGPLVSLINPISDDTSEINYEIHELASNLICLLVPLHIAGALVASYQHKENLIKAMITGIKRV